MIEKGYRSYLNRAGEMALGPLRSSRAAMRAAEIRRQRAFRERLLFIDLQARSV